MSTRISLDPYLNNSEKKSISLSSLVKIFNNNDILNDNDLISAIIYLNPYKTYKIEYPSYIILNFPESHNSFLLSITQAVDFKYIEDLLKNFEVNNDNNSFSINTIKKLSEKRYVINMPFDLYFDFSNDTFNIFECIIGNDYINQPKFPVVKEQITRLLQFLGIKGNVFPYAKKNLIFDL